jgi:hypothetical protein
MEKNMISRKTTRLGLLFAAEIAILGACSSEGGDAPGTAGSPGLGGSATTAGSVGTSGSSSGATNVTAGTSPMGGVPMGGTGTAAPAGTGGAAAGNGGTASGGTASGGTASGGTASGGTTATAGAGGTVIQSGGTGGTGSGTCQKGQVKPAEVVIMGESFYAIAPQYIQKRIEENARKAGALAANASYRNVAVSGQNMNYIATTEWTAATQGGASVKFVIMDGGGIDCLGGGCAMCSNTFKTLLDKMGAAGVKDVLYTRYPEPGAPPGSNASLKACLDSTMPGMQTTCAASTSPRCHWVDLRPVFVAGDTTDGLHPTQSGGNHVGDLIWSEMVKACLAQ